MRVRIFELRLLAGTLAIGWAITAGIVLVAYRPGGPYDLAVGLMAGLPIAVAIAGLLWPPVARGGQAFAAIVWLGLGALLLLVPAATGVFNQIAAGGTQTLMPSLEAAYPWILALFATSLFTGLGVAGESLGQTALRRRRLIRGAALAVVATFVVGSAFTGAAIANELAIRGGTVNESRFGPTGPSDPPQCDEPLSAGPGARVDLALSGEVDGRTLGRVDIRGTRRGEDVRWLAYVATPRQLGTYGAARVDGRGWTRQPGTGWRAAPSEAVAAAGLDARVVELALGEDERLAAESVGTSIFEGARARQCRLAIDGETFVQAFPQAGWLVGDADLGRWRGTLDYWIFVDGQVGRVAAHVSGEGATIAPGALQATIRATMIATERDRELRVPAPID